MGDIRSVAKQSPPVDVTRPYNPATLHGKTILVTGAANGLGAHMSREWASHGANICIGDIDDRAGEALVADLRARHPYSVFAYQHCDVTDWDSQVSLFEAAVRASPHGHIDIVVPNAGILNVGKARQFENPELVDGKLPRPSTTLFDVNINAAYYTTHLAIYHLSSSIPSSPGRDKAKDRCILLIGSLASVATLAGQCNYTMSKHAILGLFRTLRGSIFPHDIRVNMLAPFYVSGSNMLPPVADLALLGGSSGGCSIADVIDAATRLVADEDVAGRALMIVPPIKEAPEGMPPVLDHEGGGKGRAVWELYAHDLDQVEVFTYRFIQILNAQMQARRFGAWLWDAVCMFLRIFRG